MSGNFFSSPTAKEPKRNFRFRVLFGSNDGKIPPYFIEEFAPPTFKMEGEATLKVLGDIYRYPGWIEWDGKSSISIIDSTTPNGLGSLFNTLYRMGYTPKTSSPTEQTHYRTISKPNAIAALGGCTLQVLQATGEWLEQWTLINAWISSIKSDGSFKYGSGDIRKIKVDLTYDRASYETNSSFGETFNGNGIGADGNSLWTPGGTDFGNWTAPKGSGSEANATKTFEDY